MRISDWSSDVCSSDLNQDIRPFGEFGRNGLKQCFLAAVEPDDAPAAGNDGVDAAARRDRASKRALAVALAISLQYLTLVDQGGAAFADARSEEHTSELQSLMRISSHVVCLKIHNRLRS